jgi:hypothetical protein
MLALHPRAPSLLALTGLALLTACSSSVIGGGGGGAGGDLPTSSSSGSPTSSGSVTTSSGSVTSSSGYFAPCSDPTVVGLPPAPCTPTSPSCGAGASQCLATAHAHGGPTFGMRMAHLTLTAPQAFTQGVVKSVFDSSMAPQAPACNLLGSATFNWLLRFDAIAGTITTGAAKPVQDPAAGYSFLNETLQLNGGAFPIAPVTLSGALDASCGVSSTAGDVWLPFFQDLASNTFTIIPLRALRFSDTHLTPDHDCIGAFNAAGLDPANSCAPDTQHQAFIDGGNLAAFISLEAADTVFVPPLGESLCVLLAGAGIYGNGGKCTRDSNNQIVFQGDWCAATNQPATPGCADALRFAGSFAASGTTIN